MRRHPCGQRSGTAVNVIVNSVLNTLLTFLLCMSQMVTESVHAHWKNLFLPIGQLQPKKVLLHPYPDFLISVCSFPLCLYPHCTLKSLSSCSIHPVPLFHSLVASSTSSSLAMPLWFDLAASQGELIFLLVFV